MILYYAFGGGLGHITRAAKLAQSPLVKKEFHVLSNCQISHRLFPKDSVFIPPKGYLEEPDKVIAFLKDLINSNAYSELWIDSFPFGVIGELDWHQLPKQIPKTYIARYVNWQQYAQKIKKGKQETVFNQPFFRKCIAVERLHPEQQKFVDAHCQEEMEFSLNNIVITDSAEPLKIFPNGWLISHSGPQEELEELIRYAQQYAYKVNASPRYIVASELKPSLKECEWIKSAPHNIDYAPLEKIFTGCGFNSMAELHNYREKHHALPFPRRFDDQFLRSESYRRKSKGI